MYWRPGRRAELRRHEVLRAAPAALPSGGLRVRHAQPRPRRARVRALRAMTAAAFWSPAARLPPASSRSLVFPVSVSVSRFLRASRSLGVSVSRRCRGVAVSRPQGRSVALPRAKSPSSEARTPDIRKNDFPAELQVPDWRSRTHPSRGIQNKREPPPQKIGFCPRSTRPAPIGGAGW